MFSSAEAAGPNSTTTSQPASAAGVVDAMTRRETSPQLEILRRRDRLGGDETHPPGGTGNADFQTLALIDQALIEPSGRDRPSRTGLLPP